MSPPWKQAVSGSCVLPFMYCLSLAVSCSMPEVAAKLCDGRHNANVASDVDVWRS